MNTNCMNLYIVTILNTQNFIFEKFYLHFIGAIFDEIYIIYKVELPFKFLFQIIQ